MLVSVLFATVTPLIIPFSLVYFGFGYVVHRYQLCKAGAQVFWVHLGLCSPPFIRSGPIFWHLLSGYINRQAYGSGGLVWIKIFDRFMGVVLVAQITIAITLSVKEAAAPVKREKSSVEASRIEK